MPRNVFRTPFLFTTTAVFLLLLGSTVESCGGGVMEIDFTTNGNTNGGGVGGATSLKDPSILNGTDNEKGGTSGGGGAQNIPGTFSCGNGVKEGKEPCDGEDMGTASCATAVGETSTGQLTCFANCTVNASGCSVPNDTSGGGAGTTTCANGSKDGVDLCDGSDLGGLTCANLLQDVAATGTLSCFPNCTFDSSGCVASTSSGPSNGLSVCGNGVKESEEACDKDDISGVTCATATGDGNSTGTVACFANCLLNLAACTPPAVVGGNGAAGNGQGGSGTTTGPATCVPTTCQGKTYACGDCLDNDADGKKDMEDPDCLGPCHNSESTFFISIPGANNSNNCSQDCYFDKDTGSGNDDCHWNHKCDPKKPEGNACKYNANANTPGTSQTCTQLASTQSTACRDFCGPLVPNGCDCFGCCELPAGGGNYVWIGAEAENKQGTCDLKALGDATKCPACTPVPGCLNTCEKCELCLGKTSLPADCFTPPATPTCSNGTREGLEQCDKTDIGGATCASLSGNPAATGTITCASNCTLDGSACVIPASSVSATCGNGTIEVSESCDGTNLGGATCASATGNPLASGILFCAANCTFNTSACTFGSGGLPVSGCGNAVIDGSEKCDGNDLGGSTCASVTGNPAASGSLHCFTNCTFDSSACRVPTDGTCGGQVCSVGSQLCGLSCQGPCPAGQFCLTGCCIAQPIIH